MTWPSKNSADYQQRGRWERVRGWPPKDSTDTSDRDGFCGARRPSAPGPLLPTLVLLALALAAGIAALEADRDLAFLPVLFLASVGLRGLGVLGARRRGITELSEEPRHEILALISVAIVAALIFAAVTPTRYTTLILAVALIAIEAGTRLLWHLKAPGRRRA